MNLKKDSKQKKCWRGEDQEVLDAIRLAGLGAVGFSASTATTGNVTASRADETN